MTARRRLDAELVRRKLATSRTQASELIANQKVMVSGTVAENAARLVLPGEPLELIGPPPRFVGRGGEKLDAALDQFAIDVKGLHALDVGASTGGFTDCLLQRGAADVVALDVGHGQLHERLRADPRVEVREKTNVRHATPADFDHTFQIITIDVSFISLGTIAPAVVKLAAENCSIVALVKPQFEAGRAEVSKGKGVVRGAEIWGRVLRSAVSCMEAQRAAMMNLMVSPLVGADGNVEFLAFFQVAPGLDPAKLRSNTQRDEMIEAVVEQAIAESKGEQ